MLQVKLFVFIKLGVWLSVVVGLLSKLIEESLHLIFDTIDAAPRHLFWLVFRILIPLLRLCVLLWQFAKMLATSIWTQDQEPIRLAATKIRELSYTETITKKIHVKELPPVEDEEMKRRSAVPEIDVNGDGPSLQSAAVIGQE